MKAQYEFLQFNPKYSFHQIDPIFKSRDVLNIQWQFFKKFHKEYGCTKHSVAVF